MNVLIYFCICIFFVLFGFFSVGLSEFLLDIENNDICCRCAKKDECISHRKLYKDYSILDELMLVAYILVLNRCDYVKNKNVKNNSKWKKLVIFYFFLNAVLVSVVYWSRQSGITCIVFGVSATMLFALSVVDWNTQYIPVEYTGVVLTCGLIRLFADVSNWWEYVIGLFAVSGFLYVVNKAGTPILRKLHGDNDIDGVIGDGDIKLMAATGLLLGWKLNFVALGLGCILGSMIHIILMTIKGSEGKLAFGPYLSLGVYITMICGEQLVSWYLNMIGIGIYPY